MDDNPFRFAWPVDQHGYEIERVRLEEPQGLGQEIEYDRVRGKGGPLRFYWPLDDEALWLTFGEICQTANGTLAFANQFGTLGQAYERLHDFLSTAAVIRRIREHLRAGDRLAATKLFSRAGLATMREGVFWYADEPEKFALRLVPLTLRDGLLHQAAEAIAAGNWRFRRCRNEGCSNWFRLGPQRGYTARREFCSDRCRVAASRRAKKEA
jgi:hypothetical protein